MQISSVISIFIFFIAFQFAPSVLSQSENLPGSQRDTPDDKILSSETVYTDSLIFPREYPEFLKMVFATFKKTGEFNIEDIQSYCDKGAGKNHYQVFLDTLGLDSLNYADIELEIQAQINRMKRREKSLKFRDSFTNPNSDLETRINLIKKTNTSVDIEYALTQCSIEEFDTLYHVLLARENFGPQTGVDSILLEYILLKRQNSLDRNNEEAGQKWRTVLAQLISQPVGKQYERLDLSKTELFAMLRNTERTLQQRKRPFIDITHAEQLEEDLLSYTDQLLKKYNIDYKISSNGDVLLFAFFDETIDSELGQLQRI
jgi:hypothetical protein